MIHRISMGRLDSIEVLLFYIVTFQPKKAFMHSPVSSSTSDEKSQVCRFCMHQRLKVGSYFLSSLLAVSET